MEEVTGRRFEDELHSRIVSPLGLRRTGLPDGPGLEPPYLHGYAHFGDREEAWVDISRRHEPGWAGGGMVSTVTDLSSFFSALLAGELLAPDLLTAMTTPSGAPTAGGAAPPGAPSGTTYGLGINRHDVAGCDPMWGHGGDTHGYRNRVLVGPGGHSWIVGVTTGFPARVAVAGDPLQPFVDAAAAACR